MLAAIACRKYKEDSFISLKSSYGRIKGTWHVVYYEVDGIDSTNYFYSSQNTATQNVTFYHNDDKHEYECSWGAGDDTPFGIDKGKIDWACYYIPNRDANTFKLKYYNLGILKLYKSDFWVNVDAYGKHYFIKLKKQ
jgi:hypothetical protein